MVICGLFDIFKNIKKVGDTANSIKKDGLAGFSKNSLKLALHNLAKMAGAAFKHAVFSVVSIILPYAVPIIAIVVSLVIVASIFASLFNFWNSNNNGTQGEVDTAAADDLLKAYLHAWENEGGAKTNADGTKYIVESDGGGGSAVGYGVDIAAHGKEIRAAGYSTSIGSEIPVEFVDALEDKELQENKEVVEKATEGLGLTEYQKHALISRVYNCGSAGWTKYSVSGEDFKTAFSKYWKSSDLEYGVTASKTMFNSSLYTNYLKKPNTASGSFNKGVQNRRDSEWILFKTGWYGYGRSEESVQCFFFDKVNIISNGGVYSEWQGSGNTFGINIIENGKVNESNMKMLRTALEDYYGLPAITGELSSSADITVNASKIRSSAGYKKYDLTKALEVAQCTWWAYVRSNQYLAAYGTKYKSIDDARKHVRTSGGTYGNGGEWGKRYSQVFKSGSTPQTNSIFSYTNSDVGHVGIVEAVDGQYMYISHCGSGTWWRGLDKVNIADFKRKHPSVTYVYLSQPK